MSWQDSTGQQLEPDDVAPYDADGEEVPETLDAETGAPVVVVRFGDTTTVTTAEDMCASMGVALEQFHDAMTGLIAAGWLTLMSDGTYRATIPEQVTR